MSLTTFVSFGAQLLKVRFDDASSNATFQQYAQKQTLSGLYPIGFVEDSDGPFAGMIYNALPGGAILTPPDAPAS